MPEEERRLESQEVNPGAQEGEELNDYWSSRLPIQAAPSVAPSAGIRLTPTACTLTWSGFTAWRYAQEERGRKPLIRRRVRTNSYAGQRAAQSMPC
jgi:hypothetical protein